MYILLFWSFSLGLTYGLPSMRDSLTNPIHVGEGDDALITCVVRDLGVNTIMWKKEDKERHSMRVLTAGNSRVTADKRFSVLHDSDSYEGRPEVASGGDVWVLLIKNTKPTDSGIYVCEVNSNPIVRSFHKLSVITKSVTLPPNSTIDPTSIEELREPFSSSNHNYTDCCVQKNVSPNCLGFCNIQSILEGSTGQDPENCEKDFPSIVKCMADGRNHVPCCIQERVPDICQDVCRGEYTAITDNIKTHFSCSTYTEKTLACIVEGIELLPSPPENVEVNAITEKSLNISWKSPISNAGSLTQYIVNITSLHIFDPIDQEITTKNNITANYVQVKVPSGQNFTLVNDLIPFTMYEITVIAQNEHGASLPSYGVRSLTLTPGKSKQTAVGQVPKLPDIKSCCANKGVSHKTCLNKLCDPLEADSVEITDLMICAPWAQDTFGCLTNGLDHTPCCKARGLPELCQQLCTGNVTSIDFNFFKCLRYMGEYTNCLLQGYGVLPGPPTNVHITNIETEFAIVHFSLPKTLGDTVTHYNIRIRSVDSSEIEEYWTVPKVQSPFVLEGLNSETDYEVYVEAVNQHGIGLPSSRITFRTESKKEEQELEDASSYNVTACCVEAEISSVCLPLCSYSANMSDIQKLAGICAGQFSKLLRCGAGGRNHVSCCDRRGVPRNCLTLCAGVIVHSLEVTATTCIPYIGNIAQCFEEGTGLLPGPVRELHATVVDDHSLLLEWEAPSDSNASDYVVHYNKVDNTSMHETPLKLDNQANTTETTYTILNLEKGAQYNIFVVSRNAHGTSLPSSIIRMTLIKADSQWVKAVTSAPHSLAVDNHSATWVSITWQPPEFSHPSELIKYTLYYKATSEETFHELNTTVTAHTLTNLNPNTQYIVYVKAISVKGASSPSETLIAWTDPAYPAFVEPPTIHPINLVLEGSSMTVLCIAMGTPMPTISLYISGRLVRQDTTRHMVTVIHNVTKDMNQISCYADNGYGTPMQASKRIVISHLPHIQASGITMAVLGDTVTLECKVDAQPAPKMIFWRNLEDRSPVIQGGKYDINIHPSLDDSDKFIMHLTIKQISNMDVGDYFCHAENAFGKATQPVSVRIRNLQPVTNVTQCCIEQNVTSGCMDACSFYLDIDAVIDKLACLNDFDKLMKCASDGSDHRNCCGQSNVPRYCLDWCRGEPVLNKKVCTLSYTKQIINCFHDGREKLPGPPQNVQIEFIDSHSVKLKWEPPVKNPHTVELYRVFWRPVDVPGKSPMKQDTPETSLKITELKDGATYECVIKAGNHRGTSTLTEPLRFTMGEKYVTSAASEGDDSSNAGVVVGIILALAVVAAFVVAAVWFIRTKNILGGKNTNGVAFENPSYLREVNMDHIQIPQSQQNDSSSQNGNGIAVSSASGGQGWKKEDLQVPAMQEVNPTLYEELKLGQDGAGFKRLKP